jgi:hypothetical protein|tara:strand:- start:420 stop:698 length:279 start_codon:yes stop_codon:yes gene_type:complete
MNYRDEDPNRTGDYDYFHKFMGNLTGRNADDLDFYVKPNELPPMEQWEIDAAKKEAADHKKQLDYFMKRQINQFVKSSAQRDKLYKEHGIGA